MKMNRDILLQEIAELIAAAGSLGDPTLIDKNANFIEELGLDSLVLPEILILLEEKYGVTIPDAEYPNLITIGKCGEVIDRLIK